MAIPCRLNPSARSIRASASFPHRNPSPAISRSSSRSDSEHQVTSAIGSPRVAASASPVSACLNPGCDSSAFFRPPPGRRDRPGASPSSPPDSTSDTPAATVVSDTAAATATALIPPYPSARASIPRYCRH